MAGIINNLAGIPPQKLFLPISLKTVPLHSNSQYCSYYKIVFGRVVDGVTP